MSGKLTRKSQIEVVYEAVEGTAESLGSADNAKFLVMDLGFNPQQEFQDRQEHRDTLTQIAPLAGVPVGSVSFSMLMVGSGTANIPPEWYRFMEACGLRTTVNSGATGLASASDWSTTVLAANGASAGDTRVYLTDTTGITVNDIIAFDLAGGNEEDNQVKAIGSDGTGDYIDLWNPLTNDQAAGNTVEEGTLTGGKNVVWTPTSNMDLIPSLTIGRYLDGVRKVLYGARGNVSIQLNRAQGAVITFTFTGLMAANTDSANLAITYPTVIPPTLKAASLSVGGVSTMKAGAVSLDMGNTVTPRDDINAAEGVMSYFISDRNPTGSINPEMESVASHDFIGRLKAGTQGAITFNLGSAAGNQFAFNLPSVSYRSVNEGNRGGLATVDVGFDLEGTNDNELTITMT